MNTLTFKINKFDKFEALTRINLYEFRIVVFTLLQHFIDKPLQHRYQLEMRWWTLYLLQKADFRFVVLRRYLHMLSLRKRLHHMRSLRSAHPWFKRVVVNHRFHIITHRCREKSTIPLRVTSHAEALHSLIRVTSLDFQTEHDKIIKPLIILQGD